MSPRQQRRQDDEVDPKTQLVPIEAALTKGVAAKFNASRVVTLEWAAEKRYAMAILADPKSKYLRSIAAQNPQSVVDALLDAARLGLSLSPASKQAYLVPYGGKSPRVTLAPSYIGMEQSVLRGKTIKLIQTDLVFENDEFERWTDSSGAQFKHKPARKDRGALEGAYCLAKYANGESHLEYMTREDLDACEKAAKEKNDDPPAWRGGFKPEMQKKCVVRRAAKHWPNDKHLELIMEQFDRVNPMDFGRSSEVIVEATVVLSDEDIKAIEASIPRVPEHARDTWLMRTAHAMGFTEGVEHVPADRKDEMIQRLQERQDKVFPVKEDKVDVEQS